MKRLATALAAAAFIAAFGASALATSSGSYSDAFDSLLCAVNTKSTPGGFTCITSGGANSVACYGGATLAASMQTPNASQVGILVTPSLDVGLFTDTSAKSISSSTETAAVVVAVTDSLGGTVNAAGTTCSGGTVTTLTPNQTCIDTSGGTTGCSTPGPLCVCGVVYDERMQFLNVSLGSTEFVELALTTMAAHSFNFVEAGAGGGNHCITMRWQIGCVNSTGLLSSAACNTTFAANSAAACAGPGTLTIEQVQNFSQNSPAVSTGP